MKKILLGTLLVCSLNASADNFLDAVMSDGAVVSSGPIVFVGSGAASTGGGVGTTTVTPSITPIAGDLIVMIASTNNAAGTHTWPTGFTQNAADAVSSYGTKRMRFATKIAGSSEPATYAVGNSTFSATVAVIAVWRNVNQTTPLDVAVTTNVDITSVSGTYNITNTGLSSGSANRQIVIIDGLAGTGANTYTAAIAGSSPSTWTSEVQSGNSTSAPIIIFDALDAAGTYTSDTLLGIAQVAPNAGTTNGRMAFQLALRKAP
jgi:hypothetical protein